MRGTPSRLDAPTEGIVIGVFGFLNTFFGGKEIDCIVRQTSPEAEKAGRVYTSKLKVNPARSGEGWY